MSQMNYHSRRVIQDRELDDGRRIQQARYENGVRVLVLSWSGESWLKYVTVPVNVALYHAQFAAKHWNFTGPLAACPDLLLAPENYSGPGRPFAREPYCLRHFRQGRRFLVFTQSGGLDI